MKRIHIRFARCIVASVTALACVGLFPLAAAGANVADNAAQSGAQSGPQSGAQSGASAPTAPATPEAPPASPEATPDRATPATPEDTPASSDDAPPTPDPAQPEPGDPAEPAPDNPAEPEPPAPATSQWVRHAEGWRYESSDGTWLKDGVFEVGGVRYAFNADGFVPVDWYRAPDGTWYASTENGVRTGWYRDGSWYLLSDSGAMVTGWQVSGGTRYYLNPDAGGAMATGWTKVDGSWNYFDRWDGFWVSGRSGFEADWNYAKTLYSPTNYLVVVDTSAPHCMTFYWAANSWQPLTDMPCSVGKSSTPTVTGTFTIKNRGSSFGHGYTAYWWTQFYGDYLFHSILYYEGTMTVMDGTLGGHVSHGCVRLRYEDAKWLHDTIPSGTYVTVY